MWSASRKLAASNRLSDLHVARPILSRSSSREVRIRVPTVCCSLF